MIGPTTLENARALANLVINATTEHGRKAAARALAEMAVKHGVTWQITTVAQAGGFTAVELAVIETAVAKTVTEQAVKQTARRGMTMTVTQFLRNFGKNFGRGPKGPGPVMIAVFLGSLLLSAQEAHAETVSVQSDLLEYQNYLERYGEFIVKRTEQGDLGRGGYVPLPMKFEEWRQNRANLP